MLTRNKKKKCECAEAQRQIAMGIRDWNNVSFKDESMFCVYHGHQGISVWLCKQEAFTTDYLKRSGSLNFCQDFGVLEY
ncbi:hypothetical protein NPIL_210541 [Nephila pilipes]|uniref:Uncharacterized protein n=1 Tax=Nephila pilipes TaxID=299642 RepID=A0A8X6PDH3_NEPPI|nr:hypothetical protein NPIL_210541 [Nephila pilipes]